MNQLHKESSPYLLQHAHNPVHWYAWRPEAFEAAKREDKPILVSIGYSTCHWCHVMERESFEDKDTADLMNEHFICIKVDREERPDVDAIYMDACQIMTGSGGWPLNCFLTPDGKPFYAGTYYPPRPAYGRPSWSQLLLHLNQIWQQQRDVALDQAEKLSQRIQNSDNAMINNALSPDQDQEILSEKIFERLKEQFDWQEGGFGGAPKFPSSMSLYWLLHYASKARRPEALEHVRLSIRKMIRGGIYDQIGGGWARYATDRAWMIPHFEKMLYDNALLLSLLSEAVKSADDDPVFREECLRAMHQTHHWLQREMMHPAGGFYAALDADSEGVEGKYYVWQKAEMEQILGDQAEFFTDYYGVTATGNWEETNILHRPHEDESFARYHQLSAAQLAQRIMDGNRRLLEVRSKRIPPGLDDKIILGWNALMVTAAARAFHSSGDEAWRFMALNTLKFIKENFHHHPADADTLSGRPVRLYHVWKNGKGQFDAYLDDYAWLIEALIECWNLDFNPEYLLWAGALTDWVIQEYSDDETGLFFYTSRHQTDIVVRKKDLYDNATPSGNSTMQQNLYRLGLLCWREDWTARAERMFAAVSGSVGKFPQAFGRWALAAFQQETPSAEIAIVGTHAIEWALMIQKKHLKPHDVIAASLEPDDRIALLAEKTAGEHHETLIYLCQNHACLAPVKSINDFWDLYHS